MSFYIQGVRIKKTAALAPMASVADRAYRLMAKEYGASYVVSEMVPVKGLVYNKKKAEEMLKILPEERPMGIQIFGSDPGYFREAVPIINEYKPDIIDINMGCPVKKVVSNGAGAALMLDIELALRIVDETLKCAKSPVTVKIRKGYDKDNENALVFAKEMDRAGVSAITVHGRTKEELYGGKNDFMLIKSVKEEVKCPVIASGDIVSPESAKMAYELTNADLVMVGRGSYGKPFLFSQISSYLETGKYEKNKTVKERMEILKKHISLIIKYNGEQKGIKIARSHVIRYLYDIKNAAQYRNQAGKIKSFHEFNLLVSNVLNEEVSKVE